LYGRVHPSSAHSQLVGSPNSLWLCLSPLIMAKRSLISTLHNAVSTLIHTSHISRSARTSVHIARNSASASATAATADFIVNGPMGESSVLMIEISGFY